MKLDRTARLAAATACAASMVSACGRHAPPPQPGPPQVGYVVVQPQAVELSTELPGRTVAYLVSEVRPQVNGIVKARLFREGADVKAGQVLYQIDAAPYQSAYNQARATLANAQAAVTASKLKAERYRDLVKINAVSRQDFDDAEAAYQQAQATVQQNQASVETARINLSYTHVTAPISGRIGRSSFTAGALATAGQSGALATIQSLDPIYVDVSEAADEVLRLKREMADGQLNGSGSDAARVKLILSDGSAYPHDGRLRFSEALVDPSTGSVTLRALFPNPKQLLLPGMYVHAVLTEGVAPSAILAPQAAVTRNEKGQATALVVDAENKAQPRALTTSRVVGSSWLVTSGLKAGDRLIVDGVLNVRQPGVTVQPVPFASAAPPATAPGGAH